MQQENNKGQETLTDFDEYVDRYEHLVEDNIKASGFGPSYFDEHKIKTIVADFANKPVSEQPIRFLNFGCGIGKSERFIRKHFPNAQIYSVDISKESIEHAVLRNKHLKGIEYKVFNDARELSFDQPFDIIFAANVFHHVPENQRVGILAHLKQFVAEKGFFYIFEHNPINPLTKAAFDTCEFDQGCKMIPSGDMSNLIKQAGYQQLTRRFVVFFPKFLEAFIPLEKYMTWLPIGAQYYFRFR